MSLILHVFQKHSLLRGVRLRTGRLAGASLSPLLWSHVHFCHLWTAMTRHKSTLAINSSEQQRIAARCRQIKFSKGRRSSSSSSSRQHQERRQQRAQLTAGAGPLWPPAQLLCDSLAQPLRFADNRSPLKLFQNHKKPRS